MNERRYSIGQLAEITGVSRRTVHFYVQRRLIDPPLGRGRGHHYDDRHMRQIRRVRELQRLGLPLAEIAGGRAMPAPALPGAATPGEEPGPRDAVAALPGPATPRIRAAVPAAPRLVLRVQVTENVTVELSEDAGPPTPALAADLVSAIAAVLRRRGFGQREEQP